MVILYFIIFLILRYTVEQTDQSMLRLMTETETKSHLIKRLLATHTTIFFCFRQEHLNNFYLDFY